MHRASLFLALLGFTASIVQAATFTVTTTADSGGGSLRQAILDANAASGNDTITFAITGTITLASALPAIADNTTITGPGANLLTTSGNNSVQVFIVNAGTTSTISGLTIANGLATGYANGAGIANSGRLTILDCSFVNNQNLFGWGGAVFNSGRLTIINSTFSGNQVTGENGADPFLGDGGASAGGGGAGLGGGLFTIAGSAIISGCSFAGNSATGGNGGGYTGTFGTGRGGGIYGGQPGTIFNYNGQGGGYGGGGGGGAYGSGNGGAGGFGGGGGGASECGVGGLGGLGGGAGGGMAFNGTCYNGGGGGGTGLGGAIFVDSGKVRIVNCSFAGNGVAGGIGGYGVATGHGISGSGIGPDFYNRAGTISPTLSATTLGGGTVTVDPADAPYLNNSLATITATPLAGWTFLYWLGDASGTNPVITIQVTRDKCVQAVFGTPLTIPTLFVVDEHSYNGLILVDEHADFYPYGTVVKLTGLPPPNTYLASWSGSAIGGNNPLSFVVIDANPNVSCYFGLIQNDRDEALTVTENGRGHVDINPMANPYVIHQVVTLTAIPDAGQDFLGWSGGATGTQNPLVITLAPIPSGIVIGANFSKRPSLRVGTCMEGLVEDGFRLTLNGEFGAKYSIEASSNLLDWVSVGTVTNTYGTAQFTDGAATNLWQRFYRASEGP